MKTSGGRNVMAATELITLEHCHYEHVARGSVQMKNAGTRRNLHSLNKLKDATAEYAK